MISVELFILPEHLQNTWEVGSSDESHSQSMAENCRSEYAGKGYETSVLTPCLNDWDGIQKRVNII